MNNLKLPKEWNDPENEVFLKRRRDFLEKRIKDLYGTRTRFYNAMGVKPATGAKILEKNPEDLSYKRAVQICHLLDLDLYDFLPIQDNRLYRYAGNILVDRYMELNKVGRAKVIEYMEDLLTNKRNYERQRKKDKPIPESISFVPLPIEQSPMKLSRTYRTYINGLLLEPDEERLLKEIRKIEESIVKRINKRNEAIAEKQKKLGEAGALINGELPIPELIKIYKKQFTLNVSYLEKEKCQLERMIKYMQAENNIMSDQIKDLQKANYNMYHKIYNRDQRIVELVSKINPSQAKAKITQSKKQFENHPEIIEKEGELVKNLEKKERKENFLNEKESNEN